MAEDLLSHFRTDINTLELVPGRGGCFEISVDDRLIFSKLDTGKYPVNGDIIRLMS